MWDDIQTPMTVNEERFTVVLDPATKLGSFLGCEHEELTEKVSWHGKPFTTLDAHAKTGTAENFDEHAFSFPTRDVKGIRYNMQDFSLIA